MVVAAPMNNPAFTMWFSDDFNAPDSYTSGGFDITLGLAKAVDKINVIVGSVRGSGYVYQVTSASGNTVKIKAFRQDGTTGALAELPDGSGDLSGDKIRVTYAQTY